MSVKPNVRSLRRGCNQDHHGRYRDQSNDASHYLSPPFMSISTHIIGELDDDNYQWEPVRTSEGSWELRPSPSRPIVMPLFTQVTLLWSSGVVCGADLGLLFRTRRQGTGAARDKPAVDLPGHVALEAPDDLPLALALLSAPRDVFLRALIPSHPSQADHVQRAVGLSVATAVQTVPHDLAGGGLDGSDPAQAGEGGLAPEPLGVVPGHDQQRRGVVGADARQREQLRGGLRHQALEVRLQLEDLLGEGLVAAGHPKERE